MSETRTPVGGLPRENVRPRPTDPSHWIAPHLPIRMPSQTAVRGTISWARSLYSPDDAPPLGDHLRVDLVHAVPQVQATAPDPMTLVPIASAELGTPSTTVGTADDPATVSVPYTVDLLPTIHYLQPDLFWLRVEPLGFTDPDPEILPLVTVFPLERVPWPVELDVTVIRRGSVPL